LNGRDPYAIVSAVDVLTDLLGRSRARGAAFAHTTVQGDWGVEFSSGPRVSLHAIVAGDAYLWAGDPGAALRLTAGDVVLVRESTRHHMAHAPGAACIPFSAVPRAATGDTVFFCGAYDFEGDLIQPLLDALPTTLRLRPAPGSALCATMELLGQEMLREQPGRQALLDRLLDVALIQLLRDHLTAAGPDAPGWFKALACPHVGPALRALHADPARNWTVAELAAEAHLSRATFARRFAALLGSGPLTYLTDWRMALARERLRDSDDRLAAVAHALGYGSEFAFAAAFKRHHGTAPGRWRAAARAAA
jgi:AraC-like DNA-binding protein